MKRQRGGVHQRAQAAAGEAVQCALVQFLLEQWAWGWMSPQTVQSIASKAKEDIDRMNDGQLVDFTSLSVLASIGDHGNYSNNCNRDLQNIIQGVHISEPSSFSLPSKTKPDGSFETEDQHMFLPHVVFANLYEHYPETFKEKICPNSATLEHFWAAMARNPQLVDHPVTSIPDYNKFAIPISIHGDGVPVTGVGKAWSKSCDIFHGQAYLEKVPQVVIYFIFGLVSVALFLLQTLLRKTCSIKFGNGRCVVYKKALGRRMIGKAEGLLGD